MDDPADQLQGQEFEHDQVLSYTLQRAVTGHGIVSSLVRDIWHATMYDTTKHSFNQELLYCSEDVPPTSTKSKRKSMCRVTAKTTLTCVVVKPLCELTWNLMDFEILLDARSYKVGKQKWRNVNFTVYIALGNADLNFGIKSDCGETDIVCQADFPDD